MKSLELLFVCLFIYFPLFAETSPSEVIDNCAKSCVINADCGVGGVCETGVCRSQSRYCSNERWATNGRGETSNCDAYRCRETTGTCLRAAANGDDCTNGYVFDGKNSCVSSVNCDSQDPSCRDLIERWQVARNQYEKMTPEPTPAPLSCVACDSDNQCGATQMCWQKRSVANDFFCFTDGDGRQYVSSKEGPKAECGNYSCDRVSNSCYTQCLKTQDCRSGVSCVAGLCL